MQYVGMCNAHNAFKGKRFQNKHGGKWKKIYIKMKNITK